MPKPKPKNSLLSQISSITPIGPVIRNKTWSMVMREKKPEQYAELLEVVQDFVAGGHTHTVFSSVCQLYRYLAGRDPHNKIEPIIDVSRETFSRFVERIRDGEEV